MVVATPQYRWHGFVPFRYVGCTGGIWGFFDTKWFSGSAGRLQHRKPQRPDAWQDESDDDSWEDVG